MQVSADSWAERHREVHAEQAKKPVTPECAGRSVTSVNLYRCPVTQADP